MTTIVIGQDAHFTVTVARDGHPVPLDESLPVSAALYTADARTQLHALGNLDPNADDASWADGVVAVEVSSSVTGTLDPGDLILTLTGAFGVSRYRVTVEAIDVPVHSQLFLRDVAVAEIRADRLTAAAAMMRKNITLTDDYIWDKLLAAEAEIGRELRVPLVPTKFFPLRPTQDQIDSLPPGMPWGVDPGYDYDAGFFRSERWGFIVARQKPIIEVQEVRFVYPDQHGGLFVLPPEWVRMDARYGHIRFVPATQTFAAPLSAFLMQALGGGRSIPFMIHLTYLAGLENVARDYPDLLDVIKRKAVLKLIEDRFMPQSGSISADGLSQSISVQMENYQQVIDHTLYGPKGTNGGLMAAIHGVRVGAMGGS